jgi:hypothetical protein
MGQLQGYSWYTDTSSGRPPEELEKMLHELYVWFAQVNVRVTDDSYSQRPGEWRIRLALERENVIPNWQKEFSYKLQELRQLPDNWNGYGSAAPNKKAKQNVQAVLAVLHGMEESLTPAGISASAEEGIAITFEKGKQYGFVECFNDGDIVAAYSDGKGKRKIWLVRDLDKGIEDALGIIGDFLND